MPEPLTVNGDLTRARNCVIAHQVNCQDRIGAGVSGSLIRQWPFLKETYHSLASWCKSPNDRFGKIVATKVNDDTTVCHVFSQLRYGNSARTGVTYTDVDTLMDSLRKICDRYPDSTICVPEKIGCGLAGANWDEVKEKIARLPICVVSYKPNMTPQLPSRQELNKHTEDVMANDRRVDAEMKKLDMMVQGMSQETSTSKEQGPKF